LKKKPQATKVAGPLPDTAAKPVTDFFDKIGKKAPLLALGLIFLICIIVFKDFLLFDKVYLFKDIGSDTLNFYYPYFYASADYLAKHGLPQWSFSYGMGQNTISSLFSDPFNIFFYIAGKNTIIYGMMYKELIKILMGGLLFFYYLKQLKLSDYTAIAGSLLYSFSGFMILGGAWYSFSMEAFELALLLLSFELLFTKGKWLLFPFAIFLIAVAQPFNLYVYGLFLATYVLLRLAQTGTLNIKSAGLIFSKMIGLGLLGLMLSAPVMMESIIQILESPRGNGSTSYAHILSSLPMFQTADKIQLGTSVMRFFSNDMLGNGNSFKGYQNYLEAPMFYCGLPCLLLMPQVFGFLQKKARVFFIAFLLLWVLPLIFPWFRYAFWLFAGDYFRGYSVIVAFVFMYYSLLALEMIVQKKKINLIVLIATVIILLILLNYPFFPDSDYVNSPVLAFVSFMLFVYGALLFFIGRPNSSVYLKYAFFLAVVLEITYLSNITVNERDAVLSSELSQKIGYNDYSLEAVNYINHNDHSFFRIDKTYGSSPAMHSSLNDGLVQGYRGTSGYSSFNQEYYIKYLQLMGASDKGNEQESRWATGLAYRPILESGNSVKYILAKKNINPLWQITCDQIATFGDVKVFRNKFVIPFGYTYDTYIKESIFDPLSAVQKDFISLRACVIKDADISKVAGLKEFQLKDTLPASVFNLGIFRQEVNDLSKDTLAISKFEETLITGNINVGDNKMMYLSIPYDAGWHLKVDGKEQDKLILDDGMTGIMLNKGPHTIEMAYHLRYFYKGLFVSLLGALLYLGLWLFMKKRKNNGITH